MTNLDQNKIDNYSPEIKDQKFTCVFCWERRDYKQDYCCFTIIKGKKILCCWLCYKLGDGQGWEEVKK